MNVKETKFTNFHVTKFTEIIFYLMLQAQACQRAHTKRVIRHTEKFLRMTVFLTYTDPVPLSGLGRISSPPARGSLDQCIYGAIFVESNWNFPATQQNTTKHSSARCTIQFAYLLTGDGTQSGTLGATRAGRRWGGVAPFPPPTLDPSIKVRLGGWRGS